MIADPKHAFKNHPLSYTEGNSDEGGWWREWRWPSSRLSLVQSGSGWPQNEGAKSRVMSSAWHQERTLARDGLAFRWVRRASVSLFSWVFFTSQRLKSVTHQLFGNHLLGVKPRGGMWHWAYSTQQTPCSWEIHKSVFSAELCLFKKMC